MIAEMEESLVVLRYGLRFTRMVTLASCMVFGVVGPLLHLEGGNGPGLWPLVPLWLSLCGAHYLISLARFPGFLERALGPITRNPRPPSVTPPWAPGQPPRYPGG